MGLTEKQLKAKIVKYLEMVPFCHVVKVEQRPGMGRGVSDLLVCHNGKFLALEVKLTGNKATPLQNYFLSMVKLAKGKAAVVYCVEDVRKIIEG